MSGGDQTPIDPKLSLVVINAEQVPIQEVTDQEHALGHGQSSNTCFVSGQVIHRPAVEREHTADCCEVVKSALKEEFHQFKAEMSQKIMELSADINHKELQLGRLELDRDKARQDAEILKEKMSLQERENRLERSEHEKKLQDKDDEIRKLKQEKQELQAEIDKLKEDKLKLQERVNELTYQVETLQAKMDNMENQNNSFAQEMEEMRATLEANRTQCQCDHSAEMAAQIKASEGRMIERVTQLISGAGQGLHLDVSKLLDYKSTSSKSNSPISTSPANSNHSSKPPTPPSESDQSVPQ